VKHPDLSVLAWQIRILRGAAVLRAKWRAIWLWHASERGAKP
jgi:hypothetical protein